MYLPFIEKGIRLLKPEGRMGYIAPNVWMVNDYGKALRKHIHQTRALDRWLDFKSHQIFDEAITYTALQFFSGTPCDAVTCAFAPDGNASAIDWKTADKIPYKELPEEDAWTIAPSAERKLIDRLNQTCKPLGDPQWTKQICQGLVTSADSIFHLRRTGACIYETKAGEPVQIEDELMHPLVSGPEAKRYQNPVTDTYLLFPYKVGNEKPRLFTAKEMNDRFPLGWAHLKNYEAELRGRENGKMDNDEIWWGYVYPKNLDRQEVAKLIVAQTVPSLRICNDEQGSFYLNNVRVNGILSTNPEDGWYLLGILNAPVCDFVFRRIAKAKEGGYFEANKQFIAPLPIPDATPEESEDVGNRARELQELHTSRRDLVSKLDNRLNSPQTVPLKPALTPAWLWSDIGTPASWKQSSEAPAELSGRALTAWAKSQHAEALQAHHDELDALLQPGVTLAIENTDDELILTIGGREALHLYDRPDTPFIAAQWRHTLRDANITEAYDAKRLLKNLLTLRTSTDAPLRDRILTLDHEITTLDATIAQRETALNTLTYRLYHLTPEEIATVEAG